MSPIDRDVQAGLIRDGGIRYVLLRPDVLMNIGRFLPEASRGDYLAALEQAFATHAEASFRQYRAAGAADLAMLLERSRVAAGALGWGRWRFTRVTSGDLELLVTNSPFAAALGATSLPVCAPIVGVLRALASAAGHSSATVREVRCAAQGVAECRFAVQWS